MFKLGEIVGIDKNKEFIKRYDISCVDIGYVIGIDDNKDIFTVKTFLNGDILNIPTFTYDIFEDLEE